MRGIVFAGGTGSRLDPLTRVVSKQLLPVYDKPLVYYPLTVLMLAGIREILLVSSPEHVSLFDALLGDGSQWGISVRHATQASPRGVAEAFRIGQRFIDDHSVALILGDNLFLGTGLAPLLKEARQAPESARLFCSVVKEPERYGVVELDEAGSPVRIVEKPRAPTSSLAVTGLYLYDASVVEHAAQLAPSARGELEITDLNNRYLMQGKASIRPLPPGMTWIDAGTPDSLLEAGQQVASLTRREGRPVAGPEEVAFRQGFIDQNQLLVLAAQSKNPEFAGYLRRLAEDAERLTWPSGARG